MAEDENSWIFDSLVGFLNGPVWNAPLQSFIEEKSLIFEPAVEDDEDYQKIFEEYKNLVDLMLANYMEDIGITSDQFEDACNRGTQQSMPLHFDFGLFEQIWAANNYEMFKRMMTQRNVELQLQALELIEQKFGITPNSFIPKHKLGSTEEHATTSLNLEDKVMKQVMRQFPENLEESNPSNQEVQSLLDEKLILESTLKKTIENKPLGSVEITNETKLQEPKNKSSANSSKNKENPALTDEEIAYDKKPIGSEVNSSELQKRQHYLRAQRDKLVALKKEVRKKQFEAEDSSKNRPKSAKAAESVLTGLEIEPQKLHIRKALAERLKSEVITTKKEDDN